MICLSVSISVGMVDCQKYGLTFFQTTNTQEI